MMGFVRHVLIFFRALLCTRSDLVAENLALRHQLVVMQRRGKRPKFRGAYKRPWRRYLQGLIAGTGFEPATSGL
jgi:hypothetical protein